MTVNDLLNILAEGIRKGRVSACSPVVMVDEAPVYLIVDSQKDTVYVTDVDPYGEEAAADAEYFRSGTRYPGQ